MIPYSLMNSIIILILCFLSEEKWCWKVSDTLYSFHKWRKFLFFAVKKQKSDYLFKNHCVCVCMLVQIFCTYSLWKCLLIGETDWRLRHQFQKASLIPSSSARPHQNVNVILNLDILLFLPFEWGTQRWSLTDSASSETGQLSKMTFLLDYFSSVLGLNWRSSTFVLCQTVSIIFKRKKKRNKSNKYKWIQDMSGPDIN